MNGGWTGGRRKNEERDRGMKESKVEGNEASRRFESDRGVSDGMKKERRGSPRETKGAGLREMKMKGSRKVTAGIPGLAARL